MKVTLPQRQLAEDAKHGMQPPQFTPPQQFSQLPQPMTMQQHNMVVNTLMVALWICDGPDLQHGSQKESHC